MNEKISLAGDLGSGKSTVSAILKDRLQAEVYSTGALVRAIATKRGMTVEELNIYMETHPEIDHEIDDGLKELSHDPRRLIIDSRMAWHFTADTFRIYLSTDIETSARRILGAGRAEEQASTVEDMARSIRARRASEEKRYMEQYGVNIKDLTNYDLVIDTSFATPQEIADTVCTAFAAWQKDKSRRIAYISPARLFVATEDGADDIVSTECDGRFYVQSGAKRARALAHSGVTFITTRLVHATVEPFEYTQLDRSVSC